MDRWNADAIERQLTHQEENDVRRAYMYAAEFWNRVSRWWRGRTISMTFVEVTRSYNWWKRVEHRTFCYTRLLRPALHRPMPSNEDCPKYPWIAACLVRNWIATPVRTLACRACAF